VRLLLALLLVLTAAVFASFFVVVIDERQIGFRTLLGVPESESLDPGVHLRVPWLHEVVTFEKRLQRFDSPRHEPQTREGELIRLDYYLIWRITDPRRFYEAFRGGAETARQLDNTSYGALRTALGRVSLADLLSARRDEILEGVVSAANANLGSQGVEVRDLQIRNLDYPDQNLEQIYARMRSERERFAMRARAEGEEQSRTLRSGADEQARVILAGAQREALRLRGEGDAAATRIYAETYASDPEFFAFVRSLEAYRKGLDERTTLILSRDMPFLRYFFEPRAEPRGRAAPTR
jgi:membrane protease subunit HflC